MNYLDESNIEGWALTVLTDLGWRVRDGKHIAPGAEASERESWSDVVLRGRLSEAVAVLNPSIPEAQRSEAIRKLMRVQSPNLVDDNAEFHKALLNGVTVEARENGKSRSRPVHFVDFGDPDNNDWLAVNQLIVKENKNQRRADVVLFVNGLPLGVIEFKNPREKDPLKKGYYQLQTYKSEFPTLFRFNELLISSDGSDAVAGSLTAGFEHFAPWRTTDGENRDPDGMVRLEVLLRGLLNHRVLLTYVRDYVVFSEERKGLVKRSAKYQQYWAVERAIETTLEAMEGDGRAGVVWHTQGSGKSLEMLFYAAKAMRHDEMRNPTIVLLTDRNDLDDQLHDEVFLPAVSRGFLPERPKHAETRQHLRELLDRQSGGIVFTTIHKFHPGQHADRMPELTDRRNVVVIADEAHRSQYEFIDGFARHIRDALPNASFLGFTGTPLDQDDRSTRQVFGEYIHVYDMTSSIEDKATVPILYESRLIEVDIPDEELADLDDQIDDALEEVDPEAAERHKKRWTRVSAILGAQPRLEQVAADLVNHWEKRGGELEGKGMVVVADRANAVSLYDEVVKLRPGWHAENDDEGVIKVVMTGQASDPPGWQQHIRNKERRDDIKARAKDPDDPLELVIVVSMWLTGFDSPPMHTMYVDKPMKAHTLMQAVTRVNRTWKDKPAGLIVDYVGITDDLRRAVDNYTESDRKQIGVDLDEAALALQREYEVVCGTLHGHDWSAADSDEVEDTGEVLAAVDDTVEFILGDDDLLERFLDRSLALAKAFAMAAPHPKTDELRNHVRFFQTVRANLLKATSGTAGRSEGGGPTQEEVDSAIRQVVSAAMRPGGVIDVFAKAGIESPDLSIFSEDFLDEIRHMEGRQNTRVQALRKLLADEIKSIRRTNVVQHALFSEKLQQAINKYRNRALSSAQIIEELIELAQEMRKAREAAAESDMSEDEYAFYDAVAQNGAAVEIMGDEKLRFLAHEIVSKLRKKVTIDWERKETVRAEIRATVKRLLKRHGYPPDKEDAAVKLVLEQTEVFAEKWATEEDAA